MKLINRLSPYLFLPVLVAIIAGTSLCCTGKIERSSEINASTPKPGGIIDLNESTFYDKTATGVVLVEFGAPWCKYCKQEEPIIEDISTSIAGKALIGKVNIDDCPNISSKFGIQGIPVIMLFKDGKPVVQFTGLTQKEDILTEINKLINK